MKKIFIDKFNANKKLFKFVQDVLPGMHNTEIFKLIRKEVIKVNDKSSDANHLLKEGELVFFYLADFHFEKKGKKNDDKFRSVNINLDVIFEDNDIIVVNKPVGLLVHPDNKEFKNSLTEMVKAYLYKKGEYDPKNFFTPSPSHRLDTNTSGIVVIPKNQQALKKVNEQFRYRTTKKIYLGLLFGKIGNKILITSDIDASENRENKVKIENTKILNIIPDKEEFLEKNRELSCTLINPIKQSGSATLAEIELWTGKKHQIRAQLNSINHSLLGDQKYFTPASMSFSQMFGIKSYFLHSYKLKIENYNEFTAPIPIEFKNAVLDIFKENI